MPQTLVTHKISPEARQLLRLIVTITHEKHYVALERVLRQEVERLSRAAARKESTP